jgi:8-oxo-dGTP pyrophosphatase MutT (NUDIX family)
MINKPNISNETLINPDDPRFFIYSKLKSYQPDDENEEKMRQATVEFILANPNCFERSLQTGHVNGSAWVMSPDRNQALLSHHRKLDMWMQLGGHSDGNPNTLDVAYREAMEESGLSDITVASQEIFDIDVHTIPARGDEPEHIHYDIRWLFEANPNTPLIVSSESKDLKWLSLEQIRSHDNVTASIPRMLRKSFELKDIESKKG